MGVEFWPCFLLRSYFCGTWSVYSYLVTKDHPSLSARTLQTQQKLPMNLSPRDGGTDPRRKYTPNTIHPLSDINVHPQWTTDSEQKYSHNDGGHFVYQKYWPVIKHIFYTIWIAQYYRYFIHHIYNLWNMSPWTFANWHSTENGHYKKNPVSFDTGCKTRKLLKFLKNHILHLEPMFMLC